MRSGESIANRLKTILIQSSIDIRVKDLIRIEGGTVSQRTNVNFSPSHLCLSVGSTRRSSHPSLEDRSFVMKRQPIVDVD
jgi:hypothetical protein